MADATIEGGALTLYDNWPGMPPVVYDTLADFKNATNHNVAAVVDFLVGDKAVIRNSGASLGTAGPSTFTYLQAVGHDDAAVAITVKSVMIPDVTLVPFRVTNEKDGGLSLGDGLCAVAISSMTTLYYGWFWTGGQCPSDLITGMDGTFGTDDGVVVGDFTTVALAADAIGFTVIAATTSACGYSSLGD